MNEKEMLFWTSADEQLDFEVNGYDLFELTPEDLDLTDLADPYNV